MKCINRRRNTNRRKRRNQFNKHVVTGRETAGNTRECADDEDVEISGANWCRSAHYQV